MYVATMRKIVTLLAAIKIDFTSFLMWPQKDQIEGLREAEVPERNETASSGAESNESPKPVEPEPFELTLIDTNETHTVMNNISRSASLIEDIREASTHHLLLSTKDMTSWEIGRKAQDSLANAVFMNHLDYDGMGLDNHEFDLGEGVIDHGPLSTYVKHAAHPVLGANIDFSQDPFLEPFTDYCYTDEPVDGRINKGLCKQSATSRSAYSTSSSIMKW